MTSVKGTGAFMTLHIARGDQRFGPYTLAEAQGLINSGTLRATDLAWYEGIAGWIPLHQVPGMARADEAPYLGRPMWVWIISLYYFVFTPIGLIGILAMPMLKTFILSQHAALRSGQVAYFDSLNYSDYALMGIALLVNLVAAILLFLLRKAALYVFAASFGLSVLMMIYNIACKHWLEGAGGGGIVGALFGWGVTVAIIIYVWQISKKGVLR
jgi:hypothetical protein